MAAAVKYARFGSACCAILWLGTRWFQSETAWGFIAHLEADVRTTVDYGVVFLVPATLVGILIAAQVAYARWRRRTPRNPH